MSPAPYQRMQVCSPILPAVPSPALATVPAPTLPPVHLPSPSTSTNEGFDGDPMAQDTNPLLLSPLPFELLSFREENPDPTAEPPPSPRAVPLNDALGLFVSTLPWRW
ncbi:hypothetical protein PYCCODRAFT_1468335 [Trametes coccinea BRFM310]|uniref:Uncharacterized protein n=1 Tax=Trametes coccinea (strain BRFM310) TaxID=1353009 RepID=A0A1Y2IM97_TRAC3|nr:hypothetical protein PYCCODRAFT_1468335 [Trametes coccinea BRFM310]